MKNIYLFIIPLNYCDEMIETKGKIKSEKQKKGTDKKGKSFHFLLSLSQKLMPYIKIKLQRENLKIRFAANKLNSFNATPKKKTEKTLYKSIENKQKYRRVKKMKQCKKSFRKRHRRRKNNLFIKLLKQAAPPPIHLVCCILNAPNVVGNSAGQTISFA